jgi:hypothetical protein
MADSDKTSAPELKPCPFCGGSVEMHDYTDKPAAAWVLIHRCPVIGPIKLTSFSGAHMSEQWNTRADLPPPLSDYEGSDAEADAIDRSIAALVAKFGKAGGTDG